MSLFFRGRHKPSLSLDGFLDSLLQKFENCRAALPDALLRAPASGGDDALPFFRDLYENEIPRLRDTIRVLEPHLSAAAHEEYFRKVDELVRKVVLPAYVRLSVRFTARERNGFYLLDEPLHGLERALSCLAGLALGLFVVWAPFIPLWSKEWALPFALGGLVFPELRRWLSLRSYERELNTMVERADHEVTRIDLAYLTSPESLSERSEEDRFSGPRASATATMERGT